MFEGLAGTADYVLELLGSERHLAEGQQVRLELSFPSHATPVRLAVCGIVTKYQACTAGLNQFSLLRQRPMPSPTSDD